jgi:hypothetical protein
VVVVVVVISSSTTSSNNSCSSSSSSSRTSSRSSRRQSCQAVGSVYDSGKPNESYRWSDTQSSAALCPSYCKKPRIAHQILQAAAAESQRPMQ